MLQDHADNVTNVFAHQVPYVQYTHLSSRSVRNSLLAHYMIEHLPAQVTMLTTKADGSENCVPKLALADECYRYTKKRIILIPNKRRRRGYHGDEEEEEKKEPVRLGACYKGSSLDKVVMVAGTKLYKAILKTPEGEVQSELPKNDMNSDEYVDFFRKHPAFTDISEGADPAYAANCYLAFFGEDEEVLPGYEARLEAAQTMTELRELLCYKAFHERISDPEVKQEDLEELLNMDNPMNVVFLQAVVNWNRDKLRRLGRDLFLE
jgi:hypothetical protein